MEEIIESNIIPLTKIPSTQEAEKIIRKLVAEGMVLLTKHCKERMLQRNIIMPQVLNCLAKGKISENPYRTLENGGGYLTSVEKGTAGDWLKVVVCMKLSQELLVITAIN